VIHQECFGSEKYWNRIDDRLALIRKIAGGSAFKTAKYVYPLISSEYIYIFTITCRAFNEILKTDRTTFGADDDYVIGDVIPDELQQRVDAVVAGTAYEE
jgi:hypothetical protein